MKVITVDDKAFGEMCRQLMTKVEVSGYKPDVVVAVARAGVFVAKAMNAGDFYTVRCNREGDAVKKSFLGTILRFLPAWLNILLRKLERSFLSGHDKSVKYEPRNLIVPENLKNLLTSGNHRVLIVDDAVDSGRSLRSVIDGLRSFGVENELRSAIITVTRDNAVCNPDYALFRNNIMIRFPWAKDVKGGDSYYMQ